MLITHYILFLVTAIGVLGKTITHDKVSRGKVDLGVGNTVIEPGVYWSIINNAFTVLAGGLKVGAGSGFYVTGNNKVLTLSVTLLNTFSTIKNDGVIALNSIKSFTAQTYTLAGLKFRNNGEMFLGGDGGYGLPVMSISAANWHNNGLLVFYQNNRSSGATLLGSTLPIASITNDGTICFTKQYYLQTSTISGTGCLVARDEANIYISATTSTVAKTQTIYLETKTSTPKVQSIAIPNTFTVSGFWGWK